MALLTRVQKVSTPQELAGRLVDARQRYDEEKNAVVSEAVERQRAVEQTIKDLEQERSDLRLVVEDANSR